MSNTSKTSLFHVNSANSTKTASLVENSIMLNKDVKRASVSATNRSARVTYDKSRVRPSAIKRAIKKGSIKRSRVESVNNDLELIGVNARYIEREYATTFSKLILAVILTIFVILIGQFDQTITAVGKGTINLFNTIAPDATKLSTTGIYRLMAANVILMLLTVPVVFYCGQIFVKGFIRSVKNKAFNVELPLFIGVLIIFALSVWITFEPITKPEGSQLRNFTNGGITFYNVCCLVVSIVYLGKFLSERFSICGKQAVNKFVKLFPKQVRCVDGYKNNRDLIRDIQSNKKLQATYKDIAGVDALDYVIVKPKENFPVDCKVVYGSTKADISFLTGSKETVLLGPGSKVIGGSTNLDSTVVVRCTSSASLSLLARVVEMICRSNNKTVKMQDSADRVSLYLMIALFAIAFITFVGWFLFSSLTGSEKLVNALLTAAAVLIIASPCAMAFSASTSLTCAINSGALIGAIFRESSILDKLNKIGHVVVDVDELVEKSNRVLKQAKDLGFRITGEGKFSQQGTIDYEINQNDIYRSTAREMCSTLDDMRAKYGTKTYITCSENAQYAADYADVLDIEYENVFCDAGPDEKKYLIKYFKEILAKDQTTDNNSIVYLGNSGSSKGAMKESDVSVCITKEEEYEYDQNSDVSFLGERLFDINDALDISKRAIKKIKQNVFFAMLFNVALIPLACAGLIVPMVAAIIHAIVILIITCNSLTLLIRKKRA